MQIQLNAPKIWLATEPVDFRKAINGLRELVQMHFNQNLENHIYVFYNRKRDKLKLLAHHRNGALLIYKQLNKNKFTIAETSDKQLYTLNQEQLTWLLAGLDWMALSHFDELSYTDYF